MLHVGASYQHLAVLPSSSWLLSLSTTFVAVRGGVPRLPFQHIELYKAHNDSECAVDTRSCYLCGKLFASRILPGAPGPACVITSKSALNASN